MCYNENRKAVLDGTGYAFAIGGVKGSISFTVCGAWLFVEQSEDTRIACRPYLFDAPQN